MESCLQSSLRAICTYGICIIRKGIYQKSQVEHGILRTEICALPLVLTTLELRLLAQWKRGELATTELVDRLEDLEFKTSVAGLDLCL